MGRIRKIDKLPAGNRQEAYDILLDPGPACDEIARAINKQLADAG